MEENRLLNRFANIVVCKLYISIHCNCCLLPYAFVTDDDNRVLLEPIGDYPDCQNEYINACYVDVSGVLVIVCY